ncbi:MAG: GNAT family N-acetyltransferase, partial [Devosia nanyangense]|nr:GNAT family N-acetyltransferase [Devosia nanyangense]
MVDFELLDNPVWNSLRMGHSDMAIRNGSAARYPADISPL